MSKLALKSAYICLKDFMGTVKEVRKEVHQEATPCHAHLHAWSSAAVLLHRCCLFSCQLTWSQTTYRFLLTLLLEWLFLSALEILRKVEENCLFPSSYLLLLWFSQVELNGGVCYLPAKNLCHLELPCVPTCNLHRLLLSSTKTLDPCDEWVR